MIRVISHELNNSLAPISSLAHSGQLAMDVDNRDKLREILATIGERVDHLKSFIEGYARFARLPQPRISTVNFTDLLDRLQQQYPFRVQTDDSDMSVRIDPTQMEQVLINLLKNAREATGAEGEILLSVTKQRQQLSISITDNGPGMSQEELQNALLPFYSTKQAGTGLGLPLCREFVEGHNGQISISNLKPTGLKVMLTIPQTKSIIPDGPDEPLD